ncbi:hypothetical protein [Ponticoccus litoralis]|uniref:Uncharacterized protein n=1 Tax=Ponticoccus litoralis TaxID=422297 RepID=A0AAW9SLJ2_9RHOB
MGDVQPGPGGDVHRQQFRDRDTFADRGSCPVVGIAAARIELRARLCLEMSQEVGAFGMNHQRTPGPGQKAQGAILIVLMREGQPVEFVAPARRGGCGEDLEGDRPLFQKPVTGGRGKIARRGVEGEIDNRVFREMLAAPVEFLGVEQQGLEIGISNRVVTPPAAAARVSDCTVPRSG